MGRGANKDRKQRAGWKLRLRTKLRRINESVHMAQETQTKMNLKGHGDGHIYTCTCMYMSARDMTHACARKHIHMSTYTVAR